MIWILILSPIVIAVVAAFLVSDISGSRVLGLLVGTGSVVVALFVAAAFATPSVPAGTGGFSHAQLETDRVMTQQMALSVDPGMQALMEQDSMLQRSAHRAYVRALEDHIRRFNRTLGQAP